jgi:hypothetical protein
MGSVTDAGTIAPVASSVTCIITVADPCSSPNRSDKVAVVGAAGGSDGDGSGDGVTLGVTEGVGDSP